MQVETIETEYFLLVKTSIICKVNWQEKLFSMFFQVLTDSFCHLQPNDVMKALTQLTGMRANCKQLIKVRGSGYILMFHVQWG